MHVPHPTLLSGAERLSEIHIQRIPNSAIYRSHEPIYDRPGILSNGLEAALASAGVGSAHEGWLILRPEFTAPSIVVKAMIEGIVQGIAFAVWIARPAVVG